MSKSQRFSLSKFFRSILEKGSPVGYELDVSNELSRSLSSAWGKKRGGPSGLLVPSTAFDSPVLTRDVTVGGSGSHLVGRKVRQLSGVVGWSAVANSGATIIGPFRDSDVMIYHDSALPPVSWAPGETGAAVPADPALTGTVLSPKRIAAQVAISRQLIIQATSSEPFDQFLMSRIKIACSSVLDQACLYGQGTAQNQPLGILNTTGTNHVTTASPITWNDLAALRLASTNQDADRTSFGFITNPTGRKTFETTAKFGSAVSIWDTVRGETEISKQVNDNRVFAGVWAYLAIATWGASGEEGTYSIDLVVDPYTQAPAGKVIITAAFFADVCARWPALFAFTDPNVVGP